jgi:hypothetical protein
MHFCKPGVTADVRSCSSVLKANTTLQFLSYTIALLAHHSPQDLATFINISKPAITSHADRALIVQAFAATSNLQEAWLWARRPLDPKEPVIETPKADESIMSEEPMVEEEEAPISKEELIRTILNVAFGGRSR